MLFSSLSGLCDLRMKVAAPASLRGRTFPEEEESGRPSQTSQPSSSAIRLLGVSGLLFSGARTPACWQCFAQSRCLINVWPVNKGTKPVSLPKKTSHWFLRFLYVTLASCLGSSIAHAQREEGTKLVTERGEGIRNRQRWPLNLRFPAKKTATGWVLVLACSLSNATANHFGCSDLNQVPSVIICVF